MDLLSTDTSDKTQDFFDDITIYTRHSVRYTTGKVTDYYEIEEILGEGAYGCVRRVQHKDLKIFMAMKSIIKSYVEDSAIRHMLEEVDILRKLDHPNILKINEVIEDMTELCTGGEMLEKILAQKKLKEQQVAVYMYQLFSAVSYCHKHKVLHRDIKPENLLFEDSSENSALKVIDFGISKMSDTQGKYFKCGKAYYSAPETLEGEFLEESDVWSCGIIMYLMLCGYLPFKKTGNRSMADEIKNGKLEFPKKEWDSVSEEGKSLVSLLLNKNPERRPYAHAVLRNVWFKRFIKNKSWNICLKSLKNLQFFQCHTKIQQATLEYIVSHLTTCEEVKSLKGTFMALDTDGDGILSTEEICQAVNQELSTRFIGIREIIKRCDSDHNGVIDYTEFLSASMDWQLFLCNKKLEAAFRAFDLDGNGKIDINELKEMFGGVDETGCLNMMSQSDKNGDGGIDFEEFKEICLKIPKIFKKDFGDELLNSKK